MSGPESFPRSPEVTTPETDYEASARLLGLFTLNNVAGDVWDGIIEDDGETVIRGTE